jgi:ATP10 protein
MKKKSLLRLLLLNSLCFFVLSCSMQDANSSKKMDIKSNDNSENSKRNALIGTAFPEIKAQTLSKKDIVFPTDLAGKPTIICIAFEGSAQPLVDTWATPVLAKYPNQEVNYCEIPMIASGYKFVRGFIDGGMRGGVPKNLHNNVATYYGSLSSYKTNLMMDKKDSCYLFLLDKSGAIQYLSEGVSDADKLNKMYAVIEQILAKN